MLDELVSLEEQIFQALELPYRVIDVASGDLGAPAYRKFDLEAWMPGRGDGGEFGESYQCLQLHRLPGAAPQDPVPPGRGQKERNRPHAERHRDFPGARHPGPAGSPPARRRLGGDSRALQPYMGRDAIGPR